MAGKKSDTFGGKMQRLEKIVEQLESETLDLEKSVGLFEQGVMLTKQCNHMLNDAQKKVEILLQQQDGSVKAEPFDPALDEDDEDE